jgi:hypothetical protein
MVLGFSAMLLASAVSLPAQAINLVTNGTLTPSASIQASSPNRSYRIPLASSVNTTAIPGWTLRTATQNNHYSVVTPTGTAAGAGGSGAFGLNVVATGQTVESPTGNSGWFLQMDGDTRFGASLTQQINNLTSGQDYIVSFYQAGATINGGSFYNQATYNQFRVYFGSNYSTFQTSDRMNLAVQEDVQSWSQQTMTFTATAATQNLRFLNVGGPSGQPPIALLSDISVQAVPWETDTLPLVGSTVLFGFGLWAKKKFAQKKLK